MNITVPDMPTIARTDAGTFTATTPTGAVLMGDVANPATPSITIAEFTAKAKAEASAYQWWLRRVTEAASHAFAKANSMGDYSKGSK